MTRSDRRRGRAVRAMLCAFVPLAAMANPFAAQAEMAPQIPLFGASEVRSANLGPFTKWTGMLQRFEEERKISSEPCEPTRLVRCFAKEWSAFLEPLRNQSLTAKLDAVNRRMNFAPYITDPRNWGVPDYWATPAQFFRKDGDCEDYAIAKYLSLRALGVASEQLRIVIVDDLNLGVPHAVLAVLDGGAAYILDNQIQQVVPMQAIHHYRPIYSINEESWWLHRP